MGGPLNDSYSYSFEKTFKYKLVILSLKFFSKQPYKELSGGAPRHGYFVHLRPTYHISLKYMS